MDKFVFDNFEFTAKFLQEQFNLQKQPSAHVLQNKRFANFKEKTRVGVSLKIFTGL